LNAFLRTVMAKREIEHVASLKAAKWQPPDESECIPQRTDVEEQRAIEVAELTKRGWSAARIAEQLEVVERTVNRARALARARGLL
jgi:DNA-binding NarL/FixJ family response regulator